MPIIKSAKKKLRQDRKRTSRNLKVKLNLRGLIKQARRQSSQETLSQVSSALDKAVKTKLIHKNKAARLKSRLSKNQPTSPSHSTVKTAKKPSTKKNPRK